MQTDIITSIIVGLIGAIITPIVTQLIKRLLRKGGSEQISAAPNRVLPVILPAALGGVAGVLIGLFLISPMLRAPCPIFAAARVDIIEPLNGSSVPRLLTVQGTACHIPKGRELWLMVVPDGTTSYYPQNRPVVVSRDGSWTTSAYVGLDDPVDIGRGFVLVMALANEQGSAAIQAYFTQATAGYKGIEPLPQGVQLMTQVRVVRK
jgi:hypothetical protein